MSFGVGDPANMRMCAGMLEGEAARLDAAGSDLKSRLDGMDYVGRRPRSFVIPVSTSALRFARTQRF